MPENQFRVITVARQFGSGGGPIAAILAKRLGWDLLDNKLITKIASEARVDRRLCEQYDESVDSWLHRLTKVTFSRGAFEGVAPSMIFDSESMAALSGKLIQEAARIGQCVIVGRGGQCILRGRPDVFHIYIYAPLDERAKMVRDTLGAQYATPEAIRSSDKERAAYVKHHYQCEWCDPLLYDAMFNSALGFEAVADAILAAMKVAETAPRA